MDSITHADIYRINIKRVSDALLNKKTVWFRQFKTAKQNNNNAWHILKSRNISSSGKNYCWNAICGYKRYYKESNYWIPQLFTRNQKSPPDKLCPQCLKLSETM